MSFENPNRNHGAEIPIHAEGRTRSPKFRTISNEIQAAATIAATACGSPQNAAKMHRIPQELLRNDTWDSCIQALRLSSAGIIGSATEAVSRLPRPWRLLEINEGRFARVCDPFNRDITGCSVSIARYLGDDVWRPAILAAGQY